MLNCAVDCPLLWVSRDDCTTEAFVVLRTRSKTGNWQQQVQHTLLKVNDWRDRISYYIAVVGNAFRMYPLYTLPYGFAATFFFALLLHETWTDSRQVCAVRDKHRHIQYVAAHVLLRWQQQSAADRYHHTGVWSGAQRFAHLSVLILLLQQPKLARITIYAMNESVNCFIFDTDVYPFIFNFSSLSNS